jgi:hypothetical protein
VQKSGAEENLLAGQTRAMCNILMPFGFQAVETFHIGWTQPGQDGGYIISHCWLRSSRMHHVNQMQLQLDVAISWRPYVSRLTRAVIIHISLEEEHLSAKEAKIGDATELGVPGDSRTTTPP